jgi:hypothetical protein
MEPRDRIKSVQQILKHRHPTAVSTKLFGRGSVIWLESENTDVSVQIPLLRTVASKDRELHVDTRQLYACLTFMTSGVI